MDKGFYYVFPAVKGLQAGRDYYITMCPLKLVIKLFPNEDTDLPPEFRAQRLINRSRIPEISKYILENQEEYVFSSLTASVDGQIEFRPYNNSSIGDLVISMDSRFLLNDGQHRKAAIEEAIKANPDLGDETISLVLFLDSKLKKSQQMFADLNKHAVNTTKSIGILYDSRDSLAIITREIVDNNVFLRQYTDKESSSLAKYSPKIFTLSGIYNTNYRLLNNPRDCEEAEKVLAKEFWQILCGSIDEWKQVAEKKLSAAELRKNFLVSHGIVLEAIGFVVCELMAAGMDWEKSVKDLNKINWSRENHQDWLGRAIDPNGRISKSRSNLLRTKIKIKQLLKIPLEREEKLLESNLAKGVQA